MSEPIVVVPPAGFTFAKPSPLCEKFIEDFCSRAATSTTLIDLRKSRELIKDQLNKAGRRPTHDEATCLRMHDETEQWILVHLN